MKNKKLMFSEARFVFKGERPSGKPAERGKGAPSKAPVVRRLTQQRDTALKLSGQKRELVKKFFKFSNLDFGGKTFEVSFGKTSLRAELLTLSAAILPVLDSKKNTEVVKRVMGILKGLNIDMKLEDLKPIAASVYAKNLLDKAKDQLKKDYPRLSAFIKAKGIKDVELKAKLSSDAAGNLKVEFTSKDPTLFKKYQKWAETNKPDDSAKKKPKEKKETVSQKELDRFAKSPLGKIFKFLRGEGNKTWLQLMRDGKAPLAFFIAGLFGYKIGGEMYKGVTEILPAKFKSRMKRFERRARSSKLSAKAYAKKSPRKAPAVGSKAEVLDANFFTTAIEQNSIPAKGVKLGEDYKLKRGETLAVDLTGGGQVILPAGAKAYVNGKLSDPGKVYKGEKITIIGTIPKGTVFVGKMVFKKIAPKKAA